MGEWFILNLTISWQFNRIIFPPLLLFYDYHHRYSDPKYFKKATHFQTLYWIFLLEFSFFPSSSSRCFYTADILFVCESSFFTELNGLFSPFLKLGGNTVYINHQKCLICNFHFCYMWISLCQRWVKWKNSDVNFGVKIQVRVFEWFSHTVTEGAILKVVEETASEGGRCELQKNRQHHYHEMSLLFCCYFSGLGVVIIMVEEDNQMRKVMPAEFPGLQDCKVRIEGETNREVNQKGPCDELIEAEGKGETSESINLNAWHVNGMTPYVMYSLWNVLLLDTLENGNVSH